MRETIPSGICKALCKAYPAGPQTRNQTNSFPLHFAAKRAKPNKEILRILLKRHPAAASHFNDYGLLPMHCMCSSTDDLEAIQMLYEAYPECLDKRDRHGRTCLHLAVLYAGKHHVNAVMQEEHEMALQKAFENRKPESMVQEDRPEDAVSDSDSDCEVTDLSSQMTERKGQHRRIIYYLIAKNPLQLVMLNNFESTPVETVLERTKPTLSKYKKVQVWGLFDDPLTARILLLAHRHYYLKKWRCGDDEGIRFPMLKNGHVSALYELNWRARKEALYVSYGGKTLWSLRRSDVLSVTSSKSKPSGKSRKSKAIDKKSVAVAADASDNGSNTNIAVTVGLSKNNLLARLRLLGQEDCVRLCIAWL
jgi:hypothetical protein